MCSQKHSFAVICTPRCTFGDLEKNIAKYTPKIQVDKNTPIYCQKHGHCTFASRKNAIYPCSLHNYHISAILQSSTLTKKLFSSTHTTQTHKHTYAHTNTH